MADVNEVVSREAIKGVERLEKATKQTAKQVQSLYDVSKKLDTELKGLGMSTKKVQDNQKKLNDAQNKALQVNKQTIQIRSKLSQIHTKEAETLNKVKSILTQETAAEKKSIEAKRSSTTAWKKSQTAIEKNTQAVAKSKKEIKLQATITNAAKGSYNQLAAQLTLNIHKYKALSAEQQKSSKGQALIKNIEKQDKALKKLDATMGRSQRNVGNYGEAFQKAFMKIGMAVAGAVAAFKAITGVIGGSIERLKKQERAEFSLTAAIKNRAETTKLTYEELRKEATRLQGISVIGDEDILKGITSQLLTFTQISDEVFKDAQEAVMDIATTLSQTGEPAFTELKSVALQLGKALNDPIGQMGALSRSGIMFSAENKKVIKSLAASGKMAEAQALMLKEVNAQYGGQFAAMAQSTGIINQTKNMIGDLSEEFGRFLMKGIYPLVKGIQSLVAWIGRNGDLIKDTAIIIGTVTGAWVLYKLVMLAWAKGTLLVNAITKTAKSLQVAYSVAVGKSTGIVKKAIAIQKALRVAMAATPWGAIAAAIGLIVGALIVFTKKASAAEKAQKALNDITSQSKKSVAEQRVEMDLLLATARDTEASYAMRNDAIKKLNEISPKYLGNLTLENINSKEVTVSTDAYTESLLRNARAIVEREKLEEIARKRSDLETGAIEAKIGLWNTMLAGIVSVVSAEGAMYIKAKAGVDATKEALESLQVEQDAILKGIDDFNKKTSESIKLDEMSADQLQNLTDEQLKHYNITREWATTLSEIKRKSGTDTKTLTDEEIASLEKIAAAKKRLEIVGQKIDISEIKRAGTERLIELQTQLQNQQITQKEFNELKAENAYDTNVKILEQETAFIVKALDNKTLEASERLDLEDQLTGKLLDTQKLFSDEALRIAKENKDEVLEAELLANQAAIDAAQQKVATINSTTNAELLFQKQRYAQGIISSQEYSDIVARIELQKNLDIIAGEMEVLDIQRKNLQKQLENSNLLPEEKRKINVELEEIDKNYTEMSMEMDDLRTNHAIENLEKEKAAVEDLKQMKFETMMMLADAAFEFASYDTENKLNKLNIDKENELKAAGENADQKALIEEKYAKKVAEIKKRQAIMDKAQALFSIFIDTWVGVAASLKTPTLIPWIIAQGVIAAALVAARPMPKFGKGVKSSPKGLAEVGEAGRELGITPAGGAFIAEKGQVINLEKGTRIFNNKETEQILNLDKSDKLGFDMSELMDSPTGYNTLTTFNDMYAQLDSNGIISAIGEGNERVVDTIKRKREFHIHPSKGKIVEREGGYFKNYLNMKIRM